MGKPTSHRVPRRAALVAGAGSRSVPKGLSEPDSVPETVPGKHRRETMAGLRMLKAPKVLAVLAALVFSLPGLSWAPTQHAEFFSGKMEVTLAEIQEGRTCAAYDVEYDPSYMNILSPEGSRGTTKRSAWNVLGDTSVRCVSEGNCMAARCALLCFLALARGIWVVLEQPRGSLLEHHPSMQLLFKLCQFWRKSIKMGDFAAPSQKDTWLYSSQPFIEQIYDFQPAKLPDKQNVQLVEKYVDSKGINRVKGSRFLKGSQAYTRQFGRALARLRTRHESEVKAAAAAFLSKAAGGKQRAPRKLSSDFQSWVKSADLNPVLEFLTK